jgi:hypothetical protein
MTKSTGYTEFNAREINVNQRVTWLGTHQRFWRG